MPNDLQALYREHPALVLGAAGGAALAGAYLLLHKKGSQSIGPFGPAGWSGAAGSGFTGTTGGGGHIRFIGPPIPGHPGPLPRPNPGPGPDPVPEPACIPCGSDSFSLPDRRIPCCGQPRPLPGPERPARSGDVKLPSPSGGGFGGPTDIRYVAAYVDSKQGMRMRI